MAASSSIIISNELSRADFGDDFVFGSASSAYQVEGAAAEGGRGPSIWDTFTNQKPDKINDGSNGNEAVDQYHLYKEDVQIMKKLGLDAYRFSISWSRVLPGGRLSAGVNTQGIQYYNNLINELLANGIEPYVTLFHWDVPQALEDEYGGFLNRKIVNDFREYAELCFWEFGDRVKNWITLNEPWSFAVQGYTNGAFAPGRGATTTTESANDEVSKHRCNGLSAHKPCHDGDPSTEPYLVGHYLLLAHAEAAKLYRENFKAQRGKIGITLVSEWWEPLNNTPEDKEAFERIADFFLGWFLSPITYGDYPKRMRDILQSRLPEFSKEESQNLKLSYDFLGLNYYTSTYVTDASGAKPDVLNYNVDTHVTTQSVGPDGKEIGPLGTSGWIHMYPVGIYKLLNYVKSRYNDPIIYITENGIDEVNDVHLTVSQALTDKSRVQYYHDHLACVKQAMDNDNVKVKGYFIWTLLDNFEWSQGFAVRFGITYVNYKDGYKRYPKASALWFMNFLHNTKNIGVNQLPPPTRKSKRVLDNAESVIESNGQNHTKKNFR